MGSGSPFLDVPPSAWLASNRSAFAIPDPQPVVAGHTLVVLRRLVTDWWSCSVEERNDAWDLVAEVQRILTDRLDPAGFTFGFDSTSADQLAVRHAHIHVIPQFETPLLVKQSGIRSAASLSLTAGPHEERSDEYTLFDGIDDSYLKLHLLRALINPELDRIDLVVSFIMGSGLDLIYGRLADAIDRDARIRIITTDYMKVTDRRALVRLADLERDHPGRIETRVFRGGQTSFHPKAYLFWSSRNGSGVGFVGSSNLSRSGIAGGVEWNIQLGRTEPLVRSFEGLWSDRRSVALDHDFLETYRNTPSGAIADSTSPDDLEDAVEIDDEPVQPAPEPRPIQVEALTALERSRAAGYRGALVVLATGLGKTWLAAFDAASPRFGRILFVAHREEILEQARDVFRQVHPDARIGFFTGQEKSTDAEIIFATVQSLSRSLDLFETTDFDYIVVDEFHHAAASSYRSVIDRFTPQFLLGLTATPTRMDGADLLALCHDNLPYECNLVDGIRRKALVPFRYWGIRDVVDFEPIPWRNSKFDPAALTRALETKERADQALREWNAHRGDRTLAFCCSVTHSDFMRDHFRANGFLAASVHSGPSSDPRRLSMEQLESGELDIVFSVDLFNEGVDLPAIDTVLLLRPTESPVVFLQQIGRGLRLSESKDHLRIIDFIGNHRSFLMRPSVLLSLGTGSTPSLDKLLKAMEKGDFSLPPGCSVDYDLTLVDMFREISRATGLTAIEEYCRQFAEQHGVRPSASQAFLAGFNPASTTRQFGGWFGFLASIDLLEPAQQAAWQRGREAFQTLLTLSGVTAHKLVSLRAIDHVGGVVTGALVDAVAHAALGLVVADPRLRAQVLSDGIDVDSVTPAQWTQYWTTAALVGLGQEPGTSFRLGDSLGRPFVLSPFAGAVDPESVIDMFREIVDWRLLRSLDARGGARAGAVRLKVNHSAGNPIVMIDRKRFPDLPAGEVPFLADGESLIGRFRTVALNVASRPGQKGNALHALLRGWFGPSAGQPGTSHWVTLEENAGQWAMRPLDATADLPEDQLAVPLYADFAIACGAADVADPLTQRSGWLQVPARSMIDSSRQFVAFARGDSMAGGQDPIRHGDALLFEWSQGVSRSDLIGQRVLVQVGTRSETTSLLKLLDRDDSRFILRSTNPDTPAIEANSTMRIAARLIRRLGQEEFNPLARLIGSALTRRELGAHYGLNMDTYAPLRRNGYLTVGQDAILIVTLNKEGVEHAEGYDDRFVSSDVFTWSSMSRTSPESSSGQEVLRSLETGMRLHLWARRSLADTTYRYFGLVAPISHSGANPMQVRFRVLEPLDEVTLREFT